MMFGPAQNKYNELCRNLSREDQKRFQEMMSILLDFLIESEITTVRGSDKLYEIHVDVLETNE